MGSAFERGTATTRVIEVGPYGKHLLAGAQAQALIIHAAARSRLNLSEGQAASYPDARGNTRGLPEKRRGAKWRPSLAYR
jgi:hypothetical protein